jgi:hypothetical protein
MSNLNPGGQIPTPQKFLRASLSGRRSHNAEIFRPVDIPRNARQFQHNARPAGCLGGRKVRQETVVAKAQRKKVRRSPPGRIGPAPSRIGDQ